MPSGLTYVDTMRLSSRPSGRLWKKLAGKPAGPLYLKPSQLEKRLTPQSSQVAVGTNHSSYRPKAPTTAPAPTMSQKVSLRSSSDRRAHPPAVRAGQDLLEAVRKAVSLCRKFVL